MKRHWSRRRLLAAAGATALAGCGSTGEPATDETADDATDSAEPTETVSATATEVPEPSGSFEPREWDAPTDAPGAVSRNVLVENLEVPWDISVAGNGDLFVTERVGRVTRFTGSEVESVLSPEQAIDAESLDPGSDERPWWVEGGEGGTLGVAVHPDYPDVSVLFVYYTAQTDDGRVNRVSRFDLSAGDPATSETVLIDGIPANNFHNGGRLTFGPRGNLFVTTGDAGEKSLAADPASLAGKILRITVNGEPAPDNPEVGDPRVYSYGHRNAQGVGWTPDGTMLATEHGPTGKDELNRIQSGANYGWPDVRAREEYLDADGVHPPLANTGDAGAWAPTGAVFYTGDAVASWQNRFLVGGLISQQIVVATLSPPDADLPPIGDGQRYDQEWSDDAYTVTTHSFLQDELGRVRHLEQGPNGGVYAITSNRDGRAGDGFPREIDDVLVRLEPA